VRVHGNPLPVDANPRHSHVVLSEDFATHS
jgi:hypothetical protein